MEHKHLKSAAVALPLAFGIPSLASASTVNIDNTDKDSPTQSTVTGLDNISDSSIEVQASAGVYLSLQDAGNEVAVGGAHGGGSSSYGGTTAGGSVTECPENNCPDNMNSNATSAANTAWSNAGLGSQ